MNRAGTLILLGFLLALPAVPAKADDTFPLLELVRKRIEERDGSGNENEDFFQYPASALKQHQHEMELARPPDDAECARHMAARKFARLHGDLAGLYRLAGEPDAAVAAYRRALACRPRNAEFLGGLARVALGTRDFSLARESLDDALRIDPRSTGLARLAGNLDYLDGRWADAAARFRYVALSSDPYEAAFAHCMYVLTQRRAGIDRPDTVSRRFDDQWPRQLLLFLTGEYTEDELARYIESERPTWGGSPYYQLAEALFYAGELYLARGEVETARRYFAAVINSRHTASHEYDLAMAEIAKLNGR